MDVEIRLQTDSVAMVELPFLPPPGTTLTLHGVRGDPEKSYKVVKVYLDFRMPFAKDEFRLASTVLQVEEIE